MSGRNLESNCRFLAVMRNCLNRNWAIVFLAKVALCSQVGAAPLDDQIEAFKKAPSQSEADVARILQTGLNENRSAKAFAAVQSWLNANPSESQDLLFLAGQSAERAGEWKLAVSFYRKLLKKNGLDANLAESRVLGDELQQDGGDGTYMCRVQVESQGRHTEMLRIWSLQDQNAAGPQGAKCQLHQADLLIGGQVLDDVETGDCTERCRRNRLEVAKHVPAIERQVLLLVRGEPGLT